MDRIEKRFPKGIATGELKMGLPRVQTFKNVIAKYIESGEGRKTMAAKMTPSLRRLTR